MEAEIGRVPVENPLPFSKILKPKERVWSYSQIQISLAFCKDLSYRRATDLINSVLHREPGYMVKSRTLADFIGNYGSAVSAQLQATAENVLKKCGFDEETALPEEDTVLPGSITAPELPETEQEKTEREKEIRAKVVEINEQRDPSEQIHRQGLSDDIEHSESHCCYISIDDIGVKHQKDTRKDGGSKDRKNVENTVIHVEADGKSAYLTAIGMRNAFAILLAFLLENHLLENRHPVFFADGAKDIRNHIEETFAFCDYTLILDWYHLKKKCKEYISSSIKGKKEQKGEIIH